MKKVFALIALILIIGCFVVAQYLLNPASWENPAPDPVAISDKNEYDKKTGSSVHEKTGSMTSDETSTASANEIIVIDSVEAYERVSRYGKLAGSLKGTEIDGGLPYDDTGSLIISWDIKLLFEYFLSAMHEEGLDVSIGRITEYIDLTLPAPAREQALAILSDYLNYRKNLKRFNPKNLSNASKAEALVELKSAITEREMQRREFLSPEVVAAFFAEEEAFDQYNLRVMEIEYDELLNDDQKLELINELNQQLPDGIRENRAHRTQKRILNKQIAELKQQEGREDEIYALRENFYGAKAAGRLAELDRARQEWQKRFDAYYASKQDILNSSNLNDKEKIEQINLLKTDSFSEKEMYKLDIFEEISDSQ